MSTWIDVLPFAAALDRDITTNEARTLIAWYAAEMAAHRRCYQPVILKVVRERRTNARGQRCDRWVGYVQTRATFKQGAPYQPPVEAAAGVRKLDVLRRLREAGMVAAVDHARGRLDSLFGGAPEAERPKFRPGARLLFKGCADETPPMFEPGAILEVVTPRQGNDEGSITAVELGGYMTDTVHWYEVELLAPALNPATASDVAAPT